MVSRRCATSEASSSRSSTPHSECMSRGMRCTRYSAASSRQLEAAGGRAPRAAPRPAPPRRVRCSWCTGAASRRERRSGSVKRSDAGGAVLATYEPARCRPACSV